MSPSSTSRTPPGRTAAASRPSSASLPGEMHQQHAGVDEVERRLGQRLLLEVDLEDLEVRALLQQPHVEVGGDDAAALADPAGEPARERAAARAGLEAVPAGAHPQRVREAPARRVMAGLELEATPGKPQALGSA